MGPGDIYDYDTLFRSRYNWYKTSSSLGDIFEWDDPYTEVTKENRQYEARTKKFDEILYEVLHDFAESGIKLICPYSSHVFVDYPKSVVENIIIEGSNKKTTLTYDPVAHEISGLVWISLGDRDLTEVTEEEVWIIRKALLIWIYENI